MLSGDYLGDTLPGSICSRFGERLLKMTQLVCGIAREGTDPALMDLLDGNDVQVVPTLSAAALDDDEIGIGEHRQMLHHRAAIQLRVLIAKGTGRERTCFQCIQ